MVYAFISKIFTFFSKKPCSKVSDESSVHDQKASAHTGAFARDSRITSRVKLPVKFGSITPLIVRKPLHHAPVKPPHNQTNQTSKKKSERKEQSTGDSHSQDYYRLRNKYGSLKEAFNKLHVKLDEERTRTENLQADLADAGLKAELDAQITLNDVFHASRGLSRELEMVKRDLRKAKAQITTYASTKSSNPYNADPACSKAASNAPKSSAQELDLVRKLIADFADIMLVESLEQEKALDILREADAGEPTADSLLSSAAHSSDQFSAAWIEQNSRLKKLHEAKRAITDRLIEYNSSY